MSPHRRNATLAFALILAVAAPLGAQRGAALPAKAGPGTLVGIVVDTSGRLLDSVQVYITNPRRDVRTVAGAFRLNDLVENREITIGFRKIGYVSQQISLKIEKGGGSMRVAMAPTVRALPAVVTEARQTGLSGVVTDTLRQPLPGVRVEAVSSGAGAAITDSAGRFAIDAKPGKYMVTTTLKGHDAQMLSVTIPAEGGRRLAVTLTPIADKGRYARQAWIIDNLRTRMLYKWGPFSKLYSREDLARLEHNTDLRQLATMAQAGRVDEQCEVVVDGEPRESTPVWAINLDELESVEVYGSPIIKPGTKQRNLPTSINGQGTRRAAPMQTLNQTLKCPQIYVWTRK